MCPSLETLQHILKTAASEELLPRFADVASERKGDGSIVTSADTAMQQRVKQALAECWPEIPMLGEEMSREEQDSLLNLTASGLWLLDPLDGTSNFASGIPYFCTSLALIRNGEVVLGMIYAPMSDECFYAELGQGALLNGAPLVVPESVPPISDCMGLVDFKRLAPELASRLASAPPYRSQRSFGSGALDWCMIASGKCQLYLHGGQRLWDYAAGQLILTEAGGSSSTLEGNRVLSATLEPRSVVAASAKSLHQAWHSWVSGQGEA